MSTVPPSEQPPFPYVSNSYLLQNAWPSGSLSQLPFVVVDNAISGAASEVNAALMTHHDLPLSYVPAAVREAVVVISSYRLRLYRGKNPQHSSSDDALKARYDEIVGDGQPGTGFLRMLADGLIVFEKSIDADSNAAGAPVIVAAPAQCWVKSDGTGRVVI